MKKSTAIRVIIDAFPDTPIVFTTGYTCRIAKDIADRPNHFYMVGSMGLAASIGIGLARQSARPVVVVDGDGSLLMNPVNLIVAGGMPGLPLLHVVIDDGQYESTGGQLSYSANTRIGALATASGYPRHDRASTEAELTELLTDRAATPGPRLIHCPVASTGDAPPPRIELDLAALATRFRRHVERAAADT
jgi:thiamine pyrophosphate-dependent acetolactate synthase large subunit-like protein